jgi:hypothetical protein
MKTHVAVLEICTDAKGEYTELVVYFVKFR